MWHLRRYVIRTISVVLMVGGAAGGASSGLVYMHDRSGIREALIAAFIGLGSAIGAWLVAALLELAVEAANSLNVLAYGSFDRGDS